MSVKLDICLWIPYVEFWAILNGLEIHFFNGGRNSELEDQWAACYFKPCSECLLLILLYPFCFLKKCSKLSLSRSFHWAKLNERDRALELEQSQPCQLLT